MSPPITFSVVVAVVGGPLPLRRCLTALCAQMDPQSTEVIVPYDDWCGDVAALTAEFPHVTFHCIDDPSIRTVGPTSIHRHRLYERRRAEGLSRARGAIVALTEDYAVPAPDWCRQLLAAHTSADMIVGGAIENGVDRPVNWALYYCDFGRFGRPFPQGRARYLSDVNVSYARSVLSNAAAVWQGAYQETTLHWHLRAHGCELVLDPRPVVFQHRPSPPLAEMLAERVALGRAFGVTRAATASAWQRILYAGATPLLPLLLLYRCLRHMVRQHRTGQIIATLPLLLVCLSAYAYGELSGYITSRSE